MFARTTLFIALLTCLICISACRKNANIWGTWQETSLRELNKMNDSTTFDMTTTYLSGGAVFTFTVSGAYYATYSTGRYTKTGNTLTLTDSISGAPHSVNFNILTLTDAMLVLQSTDTISLSPLTTVQFIYTLSPA